MPLNNVQHKNNPGQSIQFNGTLGRAIEIGDALSALMVTVQWGPDHLISWANFMLPPDGMNIQPAINDWIIVPSNGDRPYLVPDTRYQAEWEDTPTP